VIIKKKILQGHRIGREGELAVGCSASILDPTNGKILLIRRADNDRWAVPGGYMEPGESIIETCVREVKEETGLKVHIDRLIAVYSTPHRLVEYASGERFQIIVFHFQGDPIGGSLQSGNETAQVGYFSKEEIKQLDIGEFDLLRIKDTFSEQQSTIIREDF